jgi:acetoacetyl-CoA synthetase
MTQVTTQPLWRPSVARLASANINGFIDAISGLEGAPTILDFSALHQWSVAHPEAFWQSIWDYGKVVASRSSTRVLSDAGHFPGAHWFPDARLNFAENLLRRRDDATAIVSLLENGDRRALTFAELYTQVAQLSSSLRKLGVGPGDRVAGYAEYSGDRGRYVGDHLPRRDMVIVLPRFWFKRRHGPFWSNSPQGLVCG